MGNYYTMNNDGSISPADITTWARWYETADRKIAVDEFGDVTVSTVFLGMDHQFGDGPPLLFETLVFGGTLDQEMMRYHTIEEARSGHAEMVERAREAINRADQEITRAIKWIKEEAPHPGSTAHLLAQYASHVTAEKDREIERLRSALRQSAEAWDNVLKRDLLRSYRLCAIALRDQACAVLDGEKADD